MVGVKLGFDYCLQILASKSPNKYCIKDSDSNDSSDYLPLWSALTTIQRKAATPLPNSFPDIDDEIEEPGMGQLIPNTMNAVNNVTNVS